MPLISLLEIIYLIITTFVVGYIFTSYIPQAKRIPSEDELLAKYQKKFFDWDELKFTMLVAAPGIILHELGHKFLALFFGLTAVFKVFWFGLGLGVMLKLISSPFLILAPGYVQISGNPSVLESLLVAFAGPFVNFLLWLGSWYILSTKKNMKSRTVLALTLTKQINMILFFFNMLPIPPFDGFQVFFNLYKLIF